MKFHIITAMFNVEEWIEENIQSLKDQTHTDFQAIFVDDMSTDNTVDLVRAAIQGDDRFHLIVNQEKKFKTRNVVEAIEAAKPEDEDVIVMVDGDDCLAHKDALRKVASVYQQEDCWMTYGSFCDSQGVRAACCKPYKKSVIKKHRFRQSKWIAYHLKTFKAKLWGQLDMDIFQITDSEVRNVLRRSLLRLQVRAWRNWKDIDVKDLHDSSGKYIKRVDDKAFSYPMLEMSGDRACFIEDVLYVFRSERTPYGGSDQNYGKDKSEKWHTRLVREILRHKKPYKRLERL